VGTNSATVRSRASPTATATARHAPLAKWKARI
jgi:hypothetical protein